MIEAKSFTSCGPTSFGPRKKFDVIYFLDMRKHTNDCIILWRLNLSSESADWKNLKLNEKQTISQQCDEKRRPRIGGIKFMHNLKNSVQKYTKVLLIIFFNAFKIDCLF